MLVVTCSPASEAAQLALLIPLKPPKDDVDCPNSGRSTADAAADMPAPPKEAAAVGLPAAAAPKFEPDFPKDDEAPPNAGAAAAADTLELECELPTSGLEVAVALGPPKLGAALAGVVVALLPPKPTEPPPKPKGTLFD